MQVVGMAAEAPFETLQAGGRSVEADLVEGHARTFKTMGAPCPISGA